MKTFWAWTAKILLVLLLLAAWYMYEQNKQYEVLLAKNTQLEASLSQAEELLALAQKKNVELEKNSIDGMLRETNKVVISGWETLLNTVKEELYKAREIIQQRQGQQPPESAQEKSNNVESTPEVPSVIDSTEVISGERT
ncbi:MAG: hypothetical protein ACI9D5_002654 [Candidatus Endobugula sp.]|jgi:hypothetical protein